MTNVPDINEIHNEKGGYGHNYSNQPLIDNHPPPLQQNYNFNNQHHNNQHHNNQYQNNQPYYPPGHNPHHPPTYVNQQPIYQQPMYNNPNPNIVLVQQPINHNPPMIILYQSNFGYPQLGTCCAIIILLLNIFLPGIGTIIMGCMSRYPCTWFCTGICQIILIPFFLIGWIWSIITGINCLSHSR
jgi:hypothetical protein